MFTKALAFFVPKILEYVYAFRFSSKKTVLLRVFSIMISNSSGMMIT